MIVLTTTMGEIRVEPFSDDAPKTVANFVQYVEDGFYDGTIFHRVVPGFVIQGGGFTANMKQKQTRPAIANEADNGRKNARGALSMARTADVNSATSQFFINLKDNDVLDHGVRDYGYAVFARVVGGMDVVDQIAATPTGSHGGHQGVPNEPIVIESAIREA